MAITTRRTGRRPRVPTAQDLEIYRLAKDTDLTYREIGNRYEMTGEGARQVALRMLAYHHPDGVPAGV